MHAKATKCLANVEVVGSYLYKVEVSHECMIKSDRNIYAYLLRIFKLLNFAYF